MMSSISGLELEGPEVVSRRALLSFATYRGDDLSMALARGWLHGAAAEKFSATKPLAAVDGDCGDKAD